MISHNHKCIFIHIPKCGGQSVEHVFLDDLDLGWEHRSPLLLRPNEDTTVGPPRLAHLRYDQYIEYCYISEELWQSYFSFTVVRDPYARIESFYKYLGYQGVVSFECFVCKWLPRLFLECAYWFVRPQVDYFTDSTGKPMVNEIVKLEDLDQELPRVLKRVGIDLTKIPYVNKSGGYNKANNFFKRLRMLRKGIFQPSITVKIEVSWTAPARQMANSLYRSDFKILDYNETTC